jgi:peptide/nickel transport system permease protein
MSLKKRWENFRVGMRPRIAEWRFMLKRIRQSYLAVAGLLILLAFVAIAVLAPVLAPAYSSDPFIVPQDRALAAVTPSPTPPTTAHIFGTIDEQYDLYYACIWGTITAFRVGVLVVGASLVIGLIIGTVAAFYGGMLDEALMRFTDIIIAFPGLVLAMVLAIAFPQTIPMNISMVMLAGSFIAMFVLLAFRPDRRLMLVDLLIIVFSLFSVFSFPLDVKLGLSQLDKVLLAITIVGWPGYARVIRGEVLRVKNEDYVEASRASGSSDVRTIIRHILPNSMYSILIVATLDIGSIVLTTAALAFIGVGAPVNYADWGQAISRAQSWISSGDLIIKNAHVFVIPGLFIVLFVVGWNLLGDALRDVLDPMLRRR